MREHPILFSAPMIRALLADRKFVTRRLSKQWMKVKAGDRLWVREAWAPFEYCYEDLRPSEIPHYAQVVYLADQKMKSSDDRYRPSIHMPRWACRILLECEEDARLERLWDITDDEADAEGIFDGDHLQEFAALWSTLHTKPGERWEDNPEVVRVGRFHRVEAA